MSNFPLQRCRFRPEIFFNQLIILRGEQLTYLTISVEWDISHKICRVLKHDSALLVEIIIASTTQAGTHTRSCYSKWHLGRSPNIRGALEPGFCLSCCFV